MRVIKGLGLVSHDDPKEFYKRLNEVIVNHQGNNLEVEIQYSFSESIYTALVTGFTQKEGLLNENK